MKTIKSTLATLFILIVTLCGYSYFKFDTQYILKQAVDAYSRKDYTQASNYLLALNIKKNPRANLYMGYVQRNQGSLDIAETYFQKAIDLTDDPTLVEEATFNQLLNAYLKKDFLKIEALLSKEPYFYNSLFTGLLAIEHQDFMQACESFKQLPPCPKSSKWLALNYNHYFNPKMLLECQVKALLDCRDFMNARRLIEDFQASSEKHDPNLNFLMGQSYLKEASEKPLKLATCCYQTAFQYFKRIPIWETSYAPLKQEIQENAYALLKEIFSHSLYEELPPFIEVLVYFDTSMEKVTTLFFENICKEMDQKDHPLLANLFKQIPSYCYQSEFKEKLSQSLDGYIENLIYNQQFKAIQKVWPLYQQIASSPNQLQETLSVELLSNLQSQVKERNLSKESLYAFFDLIETWNFSTEKRELLLNTLTPFIKEMWLENGEEAWEITQFLEASIFNQDPEGFSGKIRGILNHLQGHVDLGNYPYKRTFKKASQHFQPS